MRIRCLIIDDNPSTAQKISASVSSIAASDVETSRTYQEAIHAIQTFHPNLIFVRLTLIVGAMEPFMQVIRRSRIRISIIPLVHEPTAELLKRLTQSRAFSDILTDDIESNRLNETVAKAQQLLSGSGQTRSHYRGFMGFVSLTPTLRERKILSSSRIGIIQNRSARLAIDYWRKNPNLQLIGVALNKAETLSSRAEESIEFWESFDLEPWEIAMYEAQNFYVAYWQDAIRDGLLPSVIPTVLKNGGSEMTPMDSQDQADILVKINKMTQRGELEDVMKSMGIAFHVESDGAQKKNFERYIEKLKERLSEVDRRHPRLTRPPDQTGYEDFKPDKAGPIADDSRRMAFHDKQR